ncbi:MAG: PcfJ domain-containing protein [Agathobacter sp.]
MARKIDVETLNKLVPELPDGFEDWCKRNLMKIPIFYRRKGKNAECTCGMCAADYTIEERPERNRTAICKCCGHIGIYEWKKVTRGRGDEDGAYLLQRTEDNNLILRVFKITQWYKQWIKADIKVTEYERHFLTLGDNYRINWEYKWGGEKGWIYFWGTGAHYAAIPNGTVYPGWEKTIAESNLKYCKPEEIYRSAGRKYYGNGDDIKQVLIAYANNPAIEMYAKMGLTHLTRRLLYSGGKCRLINRRGKNVKQQVRLRDKQLINRLVEEKGDLDILEILQMEQKTGIRYTYEQEKFLKSLMNRSNYKNIISTFLRYMTVQQLMNRIKKYAEEKDSYGEYSTITRYYDYLVMRETLGYDMTNEVYRYPKNLRKAHDKMVKEQQSRKDEMYIVEKNKTFVRIAENFEQLNKKYNYQYGEYIIRPAKSAEEIILEGRALHHCVGSSDTYMRRHAKGTSYILLMRRKDKQEKPYYTIEIDGNTNELRQWYAAHDKKPNEKEIEAWLNRYTKHLKRKEKKVKSA